LLFPSVKPKPTGGRMNRWRLDPAMDKREQTEPLRVSLAELMAQAAARKDEKPKGED
jgi:hypothetical protein